MTEKIYYKFIQFALGTYEGKEFLDGSALNGFDWQRFYDFAKKQTLVGIIMEGISRLPKAVAPKQGLLMNWFMMSQNISRMNFMLNEATVGVYNRVKAAGYDCCILKGQANAAMYANPAARTPGDVDMWVDASREEIRQLAQTLAKENGRIDEESYNHIALTTNDISVELHYTPGFMANFTYNRRLQQWFRESIDAQCRNMIALPDEAGEVAAPTADFNAVYQLYHLYHHYFYEGVGLRQVVDYYYVILNFELGVLNCRLRDEELKNCELESQNSKLNNSKSAKPTIQKSTLKTQNLFSECLLQLAKVALSLAELLCLLQLFSVLSLRERLDVHAVLERRNAVHNEAVAYSKTRSDDVVLAVVLRIDSNRCVLHLVVLAYNIYEVLVLHLNHSVLRDDNSRRSYVRHYDRA